MNSLKYYKIYDDAKPPEFGTDGSACFDICAYIKEDMEISVYDMSNRKHKIQPEWCDVEYNPELVFRIAPADRVLIPTGLILDIPDGHSVRLHTRSSVSLKRGLTMPNGEGIIDSDYHHQTFVMLHNASADEVFIMDGERIAQGELVKTFVYKITETKNVPKQTTTRIGGFGSTGKQ